MQKTTILSFLLLFLFLLLQQSRPRALWQEDTIWPGETWPTSTPEAEGIDVTVINAIHSDITIGKYGLIDEFLLIRHGKVVAMHHYKQNYDSVARHYDTIPGIYNYDDPELKDRIIPAVRK
jgi:hypothetical protein